MLCYVMLCYVVICFVMLCYVMLCYVMLCYVMLCQKNGVTVRADTDERRGPCRLMLLCVSWLLRINTTCALNNGWRFEKESVKTFCL